MALPAILLAAGASHAAGAPDMNLTGQALVDRYQDLAKSGRNVRTFVGSYDFHLVRNDGVWWIDSFRFNLKHLDGNRDLEKDR